MERYGFTSQLRVSWMQSDMETSVLTPQFCQVEKGHLARLTGHNNPDSANRIWYIVKKKLMATNASPSGSATSLVDVDTPTKGPKKTPAKMRAQTSKKRTKKQAEDDDEEVDAEVDEKPAKRVKKEVLEDAGLDFKDEP